MSNPDVMSGWPSSLVEISEVIGVGATLNLVDAFRGLDYCYVPTAVTPEHRIVQAIGPAAAAKLIERFAGDKLFLPLLAVSRHRKRLIAEADGNTSDVALRFGVSPRWVRAVRNERRPDPNQIDMFATDPAPATKAE